MACQAFVWNDDGALLFGPIKQIISVKYLSKYSSFHSRASMWKRRLQSGVHFALVSLPYWWVGRHTAFVWAENRVQSLPTDSHVNLGTISRRVYESIIQILRKFSCVIRILRIQLGHKFAHVTTAELSWHVQNWELII